MSSYCSSVRCFHFAHERCSPCGTMWCDSCLFTHQQQPHARNATVQNLSGYDNGSGSNSTNCGDGSSSSGMNDDSKEKEAREKKKAKVVSFTEEHDQSSLLASPLAASQIRQKTLLEACLAFSLSSPSFSSSSSSFTLASVSALEEISQLLQEKEQTSERAEQGKKSSRTKYDPNIHSKRGWPLLCEMVAAHQTDIVKLLLSAHANVHATTTTREWTCLHVFAKFLPPKHNNSATSASIFTSTAPTTPSTSSSSIPSTPSTPFASSNTVTSPTAHDNLTALFLTLVEAKADLNALDRDKETPADAAVQNDRTDVVHLLLSARVDPIQISTRNGWSLLHQAIFYHSKRCIDFFIFSLASNVRDELVVMCEPLTFQSPLHFAAKADNLDCCKKLLSINVVANNAHCIDQAGCTPLHLASIVGASFHLLDTLKADIQTPDNNGNAPLAVASTADTVRSLVLLRASVNHVNKLGQTALSVAVSQGAIDIVECLLQLHADVNIADYEGNTPLHLAAKLFSIHARRIMTCLLDAGCVVSGHMNNAGQTALEVAKLSQASPAVVLLLRNASAPLLFQLLLKGDVNKAQTLVLNDPSLANLTFEGSSALHQACKAKDNAVACVELLLESGADPGIVDTDGSTSLHVAASEGRSELIPVLAKTSIKLNALDKQQQTALHKACETGHVQCVERLVETAIDVEARDRNGYSAIELACRNGVSGAVEILHRVVQPGSATLLRVASSVCDVRTVALTLESKCDVNIIYEEGNTALFYALQDSDGESDSDKEDEDRIEVVRLLVGAKADVAAVNNSNISVLKYAKLRNHRSCRKIIEKALKS